MDTTTITSPGMETTDLKIECWRKGVLGFTVTEKITKAEMAELSPIFEEPVTVEYSGTSKDRVEFSIADRKGKYHVRSYAGGIEFTGTALLRDFVAIDNGSLAIILSNVSKSKKKYRKIGVVKEDIEKYLRNLDIQAKFEPTELTLKLIRQNTVSVG